jgi:PIN domain nuclease of toxin-antitoxin system
MARYMIDTNILYYIIEEQDRLTKDVKAIVYNYENALYISIETVKELIVAHRNKNLLAHRWKTAKELVDAITEETNVDILPMDFKVISRMAQLQINTAENHNDPSDHIIIAHAMTVGMPLISSDRKFPFYRTQGLDLVSNF